MQCLPLKVEEDKLYSPVFCFDETDELFQRTLNSERNKKNIYNIKF